MLNRIRKYFILVAACAVLSNPVDAALIPVAVYEFNGNLNPESAGPTLMLVGDTTEVYQTDLVFETSKSVYLFGRTANGGFSLDASGLVSPTEYSVELVFDFDGTSGFRRILNAQNPSADEGFYLNSDDRLHLEVNPPETGGPGGSAGAFSDVGYHHVVVTNTPTSGGGRNEVRYYLDGNLQVVGSPAFTPSSNLLVFTDPLLFFRDNTSESSSGRIDVLRLYNYVLTPDDVRASFGIAAVPEPSTIALSAAGLGFLVLFRRRLSKKVWKQRETTY